MVCRTLRLYSQVTEEELEPPTQTPGKAALSQVGGTESGTLVTHSALIDDELRVVVEARPWAARCHQEGHRGNGHI